MLRCYITDSHQAGGSDALFTLIARALEIGVELIQIREKEWSPRTLVEFSRRVLALPNPHRSLVVLNERVDVGLACGAHGVHLPSNRMAPAKLRGILPHRFLVGVSCHNREEIVRAQEEDADYVFIAPVFRPLSKTDSREPLGVSGLREAVAGIQIPSFALGGISRDTMNECLGAGAPGVAGISLFQQDLLL